MLQNDSSLIPKANIAPTIWRCSWYNTVLTDNNIDSYCYNKGDAVWVNTEDLAQFTAANKQYILTIILSNSVLRKKYMQAEIRDYPNLTVIEDGAHVHLSSLF